MEKLLEVSPPKIITTSSSSDGLFSDVIKSTTQRAQAIQDMSSDQKDTGNIGYYVDSLNHSLGLLMNTSSVEEIRTICLNQLNVFCEIFSSLQKITYTREKNKDLRRLSEIVSGSRGGVWEGKKDDTVNEFGHSNLFVEMVRVKMDDRYSEEITELCREILDISDLIILYFLRFVRTDNMGIEDEKTITIQEIILAEQSMLARRVTPDEIRLLLATTERLLKKAPEKIKEKYLNEYRGCLVHTNGMPQSTPQLGKLKEIIEHTLIAATDPVYQADIKKLLEYIEQLLNKCKHRLPHQITVDYIKNSVVGFYNGITLYRELQELEKGLRSTPLDSPFCAERGIENLSGEMEKTIFELMNTGYAIIGGVSEEKRDVSMANPNLQKDMIFARAYVSKLLKKGKDSLSQGTENDVKTTTAQFEIDLALLREIHEVEGWYHWMTSEQISSEGKIRFSEDFQKDIAELSQMKKSIPKKTVNRFTKLATHKLDLVWNNPVLSNIFHDIILFASKINLLSDVTTIDLLMMIKKTVPNSKEGVEYIQSILRSILRSSIALQPRSITKNNILTIAREWSTYCGENYPLYIELCEWLSKNYVIHNDIESRIIGEEIITTLRKIQPSQTGENIDTSRSSGRLEALGALFKHGRSFERDSIELMMERISTSLLFGQFQVEQLKPVKQIQENFLGGTSEEISFPEITTPYYAYYSDEIAFQFTPLTEGNQGIDGLFQQVYWFIIWTIENHKLPPKIQKTPTSKK